MTGTELVYLSSMTTKLTGASVGTDVANTSSMTPTCATGTGLHPYKVETNKKEVNMNTTVKLTDIKLSGRFLSLEEAFTLAVGRFEEDFVKDLVVCDDNTVRGRLFYKNEEVNAKVLLPLKKGLFQLCGSTDKNCTHVVFLRPDHSRGELHMYIFKALDYERLLWRLDAENRFFDKKAKFGFAAIEEKLLVEKAEKAGLCKFFRLKKTMMYERFWKEDGTEDFDGKYIYEDVLGLRRLSWYEIRRGNFKLSPELLEFILSELTGEPVHLMRNAYNYQEHYGTEFYAYTRFSREKMRLLVMLNSKHNGLFYFKILHKHGYEGAEHITDLNTTHRLLLDFQTEDQLVAYFIDEHQLVDFAQNARSDKSFFGEDREGCLIYKRAFRFPESLDRHGVKYKKCVVEAGKNSVSIVYSKAGKAYETDA